jgi:hypothetical protein
VFLSFVLLFVLTALAAVAALLVSLRAGLSGRAELIVAATVTWNGIILFPIYVLGWASRLSATSLAFASTFFSLSVVALMAQGRPWRDSARAVGRAALGLLRLPLDAFLLLARPASGVLVVLLGTFGLVLWSIVSAYLAHTMRMWDCFWYHEPIVAFTLQYHGFAIVPLPASLQRIDSLPRVSEMTALWFVIFTDRRLIDIGNSLISPAIIASEYLLCVRFAKSRVAAIGWACAFYLMPAIVWELGSTLVDDHVAFVLLAALAFALRPKFDLSHALLAALALTLAVGLKYQTLVPTFALALIVLVRIWLVQGSRVLSRAAVTFVGTVAIVGFGATTYLRNYLVYKNPFWPFLFPGHQEWPGMADRGQDLTKPTIDINIPYGEALKQLFTLEGAKQDYGLGFAWVILPLFVLAMVVLGIQVLGCAARLGRARPGSPKTDWRSLLTVFVMCLPALAVVWTSPALNQARYHVFVVGSMIALIAWMTGNSRLGGIAGEGAIGAVCVITVMGYFDTEPRFILSPHQVMELAKRPYPEREVADDLGSVVSRDVGLARESELGPGDIVAFGDDYGGFPSEFFNNRFSNRAIYLANEATFMEDADAIGAKWIYCQGWTACSRNAPAHGWESIGELHSVQRGAVYRRAAPH